MRERRALDNDCDAMKTCLYKLYIKLELVYVGISGRSLVRLYQHSKKFWFEDITNAEFVYFDTQEEAAAAERLLIEQHQPRFNKMYTEEYNNRTSLRERRREQERQDRLHILSRRHRNGWRESDLAVWLGVPRSEVRKRFVENNDGPVYEMEDGEPMFYRSDVELWQRVTGRPCGPYYVPDQCDKDADEIWKEARALGFRGHDLGVAVTQKRHRGIPLPVDRLVNGFVI